MTRGVALRRALGASALLVALAAGTAACGGGGGGGGVQGDAIEALGADLVPRNVLGLRVTPEEPGSVIEGVDDSYLEALGLFAFREGDLLQATLQIGKLASDDIDVESTDFRRSIATQVGGAQAQAFRMGEQVVYLTSGRKQSITVWFEGDLLHVLSARDTFGQPRTLARVLIEGEERAGIPTTSTVARDTEA